MLRFSGHVIGNGARVFEEGSKLGVEGMVSKQVDKPYMPGNRGVWVKTKFLNRQEFVIVGWTDPEGSRSSLGSLLLGYYRDDGKLIYAGRAGTGMTVSELTALLNKLRPLASDKMTVDVPPPKATRFGTPLVLSRVHWVRPELVAEVTYLTWTADGLLRHVVYEGLREDKSPRDVRPHRLSRRLRYLRKTPGLQCRRQSRGTRRFPKRPYAPLADQGRREQPSHETLQTFV